VPDDDVDRFAELYRANADALFAYALSRSSPDGAAEAVEETFLVAWRRIGELPVEARPWLSGVARKVLSHQRRASERHAALGLRATAYGAGEGFEPDHAELVAEHERVRRALAALTEADRELLCLSAWGRLSPEEASRALGCTKPAFSVRLHRARRRFEAALVAEDRQADAREAEASGFAAEATQGQSRPTAASTRSQPPERRLSTLSKEAVP
jgi:RNA polymerase sigma factor (sigma-70 family)